MIASIKRSREDAMANVRALSAILALLPSMMLPAGESSADTYPSVTLGSPDRAIRRRRPDRCDRADRRAEAVGGMGPTGLYRKCAGRRRQHRRHHGGARAS